MKVKVILKSLLFSYAVTGAFLLLLAFLLFQFDLGEKPVTAGIVAVYILSCFSGGFMSGKILRTDKYLWGILVGDRKSTRLNSSHPSSSRMPSSA